MRALGTMLVPVALPPVVSCFTRQPGLRRHASCPACVHGQDAPRLSVAALDIAPADLPDRIHGGEGQGAMPEISRFFGIVIAMFYSDHEPPRFHARYGQDQTIIGLDSLRVLEGRLPPRALGLVMEWAAVHQAVLRADWELARE